VRLPSDEQHRLAHGGKQVQRLGSHRAGQDPFKWSPRAVTRDHPRFPASNWWLGVDGVTLDESRICKSYGGMWQVKREASGL